MEFADQFMPNVQITIMSFFSSKEELMTYKDIVRSIRCPKDPLMIRLKPTKVITSPLNFSLIMSCYPQCRKSVNVGKTHEYRHPLQPVC